MSSQRALDAQATRRIGVLGSANSPYVRRLIRAADGRDDVQLETIGFGELAVEIDRAVKPADCLANLDALLVRSMPLGSLEQVIFRMDCLQVLRRAGTAVINAPRCLEVAIDKWLTLDRLRSAGIEVPWTIACQSRDAALAAFERLGGDVVVKPLFGGEGRGLLRVTDSDMAWRVFSTLQQLDSVMYLQQFQAHMGYDVRVLMIGQEPFAIQRHAGPAEWRTNLSQGSRAVAHTLTDQQLELARRCVRAVDGQVIGVDLLPCRDGRLTVLEVNAVPGWRGVERALGVDIADKILTYARDASQVSDSRDSTQDES